MAQVPSTDDFQYTLLKRSDVVDEVASDIAARRIGIYEFIGALSCLPTQSRRNVFSAVYHSLCRVPESVGDGYVWPRILVGCLRMSDKSIRAIGPDPFLNALHTEEPPLKWRVPLVQKLQFIASNSHQSCPA